MQFPSLSMQRIASGQSIGKILVTPQEPPLVYVKTELEKLEQLKDQNFQVRYDQDL